MEAAERVLGKADGIVIPGGFGDRGVEGKTTAIEYARTHNVPMIGLCLGFQLSVVEFSRHVLGMKDAHSTEFNKTTSSPVIDILPEQVGVTEMGGTMRLGAQRVLVRKGTLAEKIYGSTEIMERHRHRYEVNPRFIERIEEGGLVFSAHDEEGIRMEIAELPDHPYFITSQFHPEFTSRPMRPAPMFRYLVRNALKFREKKGKGDE